MSARVHPFWHAPAVVPDAEHLRLALEFLNPECGREYLRREGVEDLIEEFERLSEEESGT